MAKHVIVVGAGFAGMSAAALLAQQGHRVTVLEKNDQPGGRARIWQHAGYTFDMGPSWYWMPDVFDAFYARFGQRAADLYDLRRLDPGYRVYFGPGDALDIPADMPQLEALFETLEPGSTPRLRAFLRQAAYKYEVGMRDYVFRPSHSIWEFMDARLVAESFRIQMFGNMRQHVQQFFTHEKIRKILEFPVLFLGATPQNTPALYSMMNHADLALGTWYPMGGMVRISQAMHQIAVSQGVDFQFNTPVSALRTQRGRILTAETARGAFQADAFVAGADYHHVEQTLLPESDRDYTPRYWDRRTMSPSSLLFYIGINKKLANIQHHNLFFDEDFNQHAEEIYRHPKWPSKPLFYASAPSITDPGVAPPGCENLFFLIPLAPGLPDSPARRQEYFDLIVSRFERLTGNAIRDHIAFVRSYAMQDFEQDYHSFKGNAYGLANTLLQTAFFKPRMRARKLRNLWYAGQLTVPGPGVPPAIISGQVAAAEVGKALAAARA